jgi:hypothetical protein
LEVAFLDYWLHRWLTVVQVTVAGILHMYVTVELSSRLPKVYIHMYYISIGRLKKVVTS